MSDLGIMVVGWVVNRFICFLDVGISEVGEIVIDSVLEKSMGIFDADILVGG